MNDIVSQTNKEDQLKNESKKLNKKSTQIVKKIIKEENITEVQDLTHLFNLNHAKKQILRTMVYDDLLDGITDQMKERVKERGDNFSNKDLIDYMKIVTDSMEKAQKQVGSIDTTPIIQINQQNNFINNGEESEKKLDRESRQKVARLAQLILSQAKEGKLLSDNLVYNSDDNDLSEYSTNIEEIDYNDEENNDFELNSNLLNNEEDNL